jgi:hypothetical protein
MTVDEYLAGIAQQLVHELEPILKIKEVTTNSALLGAYTEAAVRRLSHRVVAPMRISTGAVIDYPMPAQLRQMDVSSGRPSPLRGFLKSMTLPLCLEAARLVLWRLSGATIAVLTMSWRHSHTTTVQWLVNVHKLIGKDNQRNSFAT